CWLGSSPQSRLEGFRRCCADRTVQQPSPRARRRYQIEEWPAASLFRSSSTSYKRTFVISEIPRRQGAPSRRPPRRVQQPSSPHLAVLRLRPVANQRAQPRVTPLPQLLLQLRRGP